MWLHVFRIIYSVLLCAVFTPGMHAFYLLLFYCYRLLCVIWLFCTQFYVALCLCVFSFYCVAEKRALESTRGNKVL